ncbi:RWD domain-containing protein 3 [Centroberyx affinis]|uniref:RWD domain-containing protein 3 n=1 Tax=Centroberyx affinis TaxID=166261 RepID=UPI003A5BD3BC
MSEAALEEVSVLSSIYCGEGEFQLIQQSAEDGLVVQIKTAVGGDRGVEVSLLFRLPPGYPSCPPDISVSSPGLSRGRCHGIRLKLLEQAAALQQEPMVHQLVAWLQESGEVTEEEEEVKEGGEEEEEEGEEWTAVLLLDHIRSRNRYVKLLERWTQQLQLTGRLLLGRPILVLLQGARPNIKEFCHLLKTVKVDVDSSGRKCKERMMKILSETPSSSSSSKHCPPGFLVKEYQSVSELKAAFQDINMTELYQEILPSLTD